MSSGRECRAGMRVRYGTPAAEWDVVAVPGVLDGDKRRIERLTPARAATLAASYVVTWPAALPASQALLQVDNLGAMVFSNTVAKATTFTELVAVPGETVLIDTAGNVWRITGTSFARDLVVTLV